MLTVKTEQWHRYDIIAADVEHKVVTQSCDKRQTFTEDALIYFIRLADFLKAISGEKVQKHDSDLHLDRNCPLYALQADRFVRIEYARCIGSQKAALLYIRYDQCFEMMHTWLEQMVTRETNVPVWIQGLCTIDYDQMNYAAVVKYVQRFERACFVICNPDVKKRGANATTVDYKRATAKIAEFLYAQKVTYNTLKQAKHPLSYLEDMPLVNFILEGFLLYATPHFDQIRRPFWQNTIFLPKFNTYLKEGNLVLEPEEVMSMYLLSKQHNIDPLMHQR